MIFKNCTTKNEVLCDSVSISNDGVPGDIITLRRGKGVIREIFTDIGDSFEITETKTRFPVELRDYPSKWKNLIIEEKYGGRLFKIIGQDKFQKNRMMIQELIPLSHAPNTETLDYRYIRRNFKTSNANWLVRKDLIIQQ